MIRKLSMFRWCRSILLCLVLAKASVAHGSAGGISWLFKGRDAFASSLRFLKNPVVLSIGGLGSLAFYGYLAWRYKKGEEQRKENLRRHVFGFLDYSDTFKSLRIELQHIDPSYVAENRSFIASRLPSALERITVNQASLLRNVARVFTRSPIQYESADMPYMSLAQRFKKIDKILQNSFGVFLLADTAFLAQFGLDGARYVRATHEKLAPLLQDEIGYLFDVVCQDIKTRYTACCAEVNPHYSEFLRILSLHKINACYERVKIQTIMRRWCNDAALPQLASWYDRYEQCISEYEQRVQQALNDNSNRQKAALATAQGQHLRAWYEPEAAKCTQLLKDAIDTILSEPKMAFEVAHKMYEADGQHNEYLETIAALRYYVRSLFSIIDDDEWQQFITRSQKSKYERLAERCDNLLDKECWTHHHWGIAEDPKKLQMLQELCATRQPYWKKILEEKIRKHLPFLSLTGQCIATLKKKLKNSIGVCPVRLKWGTMVLTLKLPVYINPASLSSLCIDADDLKKSLDEVSKIIGTSCMRRILDITVSVDDDTAALQEEQHSYDYESWYIQDATGLDELSSGNNNMLPVEFSDDGCSVRTYLIYLGR